MFTNLGLEEIAIHPVSAPKNRTSAAGKTIARWYSDPQTQDGL